MPGERLTPLGKPRHKRREPCCESEARRYLAALPPVAPDGADLDAAWAEAEAALPGGWRVTRLDFNRLLENWLAMAEHQRDAGSVVGSGRTPAAALRELARRLRAGEGGKG